MLIDTDVLIWLARGNDNAKRHLLNDATKYISVITYMEMLQGMRNNQEMQAFLKFIKVYHVEVLPINEHIGNMAAELVKTYALSHAMQMADALIASSAIHYRKPLLSANAKHYQFIDDLKLQKFIV